MRRRSLVRATAAMLLAAAMPATGVELFDLGPGAYWMMTPATDAPQGADRPQVQVPLRGGPVMRMPVVVTHGTRYTATMVNTVGAMGEPERTLELGVRAVNAAGDANKVRDKVQLSFTDQSGARDLRVDIEERAPRYVAFDIRFDEDYELPEPGQYLIHFQASQLGMGGQRGTSPPPFAIRVAPSESSPDGLVDLQLWRRWSTRAGGGAHVDEAMLPDSLPPIRRGDWHRLILRLVPGYDTPGQIWMWHWNLSDGLRDDRCARPLDQWTARWGYEPPPGARRGHPTRLLQYGLGIYRQTQPRDHVLEFRNVRYGTTYADVAANFACTTSYASLGR